MAGPISTSTTNFNQTVQVLIQKVLETELRNPLPHLMPGNFLPAQYVKGSNGTMRFLRAADLSVLTNSGTITPGTAPWLTEGTPPTAEDLTLGYEEIAGGQVGRTISITDLALMESNVDLYSVAANKIARSMIETADAFVAVKLGAGTNVIYAASAASRAALSLSTGLVGADVKTAAALLKQANVPTFSDGTYRGIAAPASILALQLDTAVGGWIDAQRYAGSKALFTGEQGEYGGVRFMESAAAAQFTDGASGANLPSVTFTDTGDFVNSTAHGLKANAKVQFSVITTTTGIVISTTYYVKAPTANQFQVSATPGGAALALTTDGSGTGHEVRNVGSTIIFGPDAYTFGDFGASRVIITPPGGHGDELEQKLVIGWKGFMGAGLLTAAGNRYIRIESANPLGF